MTIAIGAADLLESIKLWRLWTLLGWLEIRQRYSRSKLGPFWLTVSMGIMVLSMGIVYGSLLGRPLKNYLPMLAIGVVVWALFSQIVSEGSNAYIMSANYIKQVKTPRLIYILQVSWKNLVIFGHNAIIILGVLFFTGLDGGASTLLFIPGLILLVLNATWLAGFSGIISARFRDFPQIIQALLQVAFFITPILFDAKMLGERDWIAKYNPLTYLISVVRDPLLGILPSAISWTISLSMAGFGWLAVFYLTGKYRKRIPYWV